MSRVWNRLTGRPCQHENTLIVSSVGVRRAVCEACGHISFEMERSPEPASIIEKTGLARAAGF
jgi:hypothetical protein